MFLFYFFINAQKIVNNEQLDLEVQLGIINNTYQRSVKNFWRTVHKKTEGKVSMKECKQIIREPVLIKFIIDIEKKIFDTLKKIFLDQYDQEMVLPDMFPLNYDFVDHCYTIMERYKSNVNQINQETFRKIISNIDFKNKFIFEALNEFIKIKKELKYIQNKIPLRKINNIKTYHDIKDKI